MGIESAYSVQRVMSFPCYAFSALRRWVRAPPSMMLVDPAKQNSTMTRRHGGAWSTATVSSSRTASPTQRLGDGSIITMEADAGADMTSQGGEDTADLPLEQQGDDAAALEWEAVQCWTSRQCGHLSHP